MMNLEMVVENVKEMMGERYSVEARTVQKNNGLVLEGIVVREGDSAIAPTIYVTEEQLEEKGERGLAEWVCGVYRRTESETPKVDVKKLSDKKFVLENVEYRLVGYEANKEKLARVPHKNLVDMAAMYVVVIGKDDEGMASYTLNNDHMMTMGIEYDELDAAAKKNTAEKGGIIFTNVMEVMEEIMYGKPIEKTDIEDAEFDGFELFILTNRRKMFGASLMMYGELLAKIAEKAESDLYILPSSVHEVLVLKADNEIEPKELKTMVTEINGTEVAQDEVLTDNAYRYVRESGKLEVV